MSGSTDVVWELGARRADAPRAVQHRYLGLCKHDNFMLQDVKSRSGKRKAGDATKQRKSTTCAKEARSGHKWKLQMPKGWVPAKGRRHPVSNVVFQEMLRLVKMPMLF